VLFLAAANGGYFSYIWPFATTGFAAAGIMILALDGSKRLSYPAIALSASWLALLAWTALSAVWSSSAGTSLSEASRTLLYATAVGAFLIARRGLVVGVIAGATAVSLWALAERQLSPQVIDPYEGKLLVGPLGYANALGALAAMAAAGAIVIAVRSRGPARIATGACLAPLILALALTGSRGAWLAGAAGAVTGLLANARRPRAAHVAVAAATAALAILLIVPIARIGARASYWRVARGIAPTHLVTGSGAGTFGAIYAQRLPHGPPGRNAHSLYLETLDELGIVGLVVLLGALSIPLVTGLTRSHPSAAALAVYVVFLLHAGIDWDWQMPAVTIAGLAAGAELLRIDVDSAQLGGQPTKQQDQHRGPGQQG
jgi:hypothetical protein